MGSIVLATYLRSGRSVIRLQLRGMRLRWPLFADILRVGAVAALITVQTNLTIAIATGLVGAFGPAAIAGYGTGSRLEYLLIPLVFGLGGPLVAMVGTNIGAHRPERALRVAWIGAAIAAAMCEIIGVCAAIAPRAWLSLFGTEPEHDRRRIALSARGRAGLWPIRSRHGALLRLTRRGPPAVAVSRQSGAPLIAAGGGYIALRLTGNLTDVFIALAVALSAFGLINAAAVASGVWFDRPRKLAAASAGEPSASGAIAK